MIVDITNGAVFFKSTPTIYNSRRHSGSVILENKVYITGSIPGYNYENDFADQQDQFSGSGNTDFDEGNEASGQINFKFGTGDSAVNANAPSANVKHMFLRKGTSWVCVNSSTAFDITTAVPDKDKAAKFFIQQANSALTGNTDYRFTFDYDTENEMIICDILSKKKGTAYNSTAQTNPNSISGYGTTGIAFGSGTSESNIAIGNITDFYFSGLTNGSNQVAGVQKMMVDRNGSTQAGVNYIINFQFNSSVKNQSDLNLQAIYTTGHSSFYKAAASSNYADENDTGATAAVRNDRLLTNIWEFLQYNPVTDSTTGAEYRLTDFFGFSALAGTSGSKHFNMTTTTDDFRDFEITGDAYTGNGSELYFWSNDTRGITHSTVNYETKDYDFGQPHVRKKVYKAYVTYNGGAGNIGVYYKTNQSGSWTAATVTGASNAGRLDNQSEFTRQELTFGSGGNNVYSFALRFKTLGGGCKTFEINDIGFVYRMKTPK